jgi:hypothetical protein
LELDAVKNLRARRFGGKAKNPSLNWFELSVEQRDDFTPER